MLDFSIKFDNNVILLMIKNIIQREIKARNIIIKIFKEIIIVLKFDIKSSASNKNVLQEMEKQYYYAALKTSY